MYDVPRRGEHIQHHVNYSFWKNVRIVLAFCVRFSLVSVRRMETEIMRRKKQTQIIIIGGGGGGGSDGGGGGRNGGAEEKEEKLVVRCFS